MKSHAKQIWAAALGHLQLQVPRSSYETWLRDTVGISLEDGLLQIGVPTPFAAEWLERRMYSIIAHAVESISTQSVALQFNVVDIREQNGGASSLPTEDTPHSQRPNSGASGINEDDRPTHAPGLRKGYTFEGFIMGECNQLAFAAAKAVSDGPGCSFNPLFIYGNVGLGKTHLLHAIANSAVERHLSYLYVTAEQFTNDFIRALRGRRSEEFRAKYRSVDILLLDDVQFIAGKEQTQEVFFHTFNDLYNSDRQIVLTCDRSPKVLPLLEDRLRSRFEGGLIIDIQPPGLETRIAILKDKSARLGPAVSDDVITFIAERVVGNIRELEGSLNRLAAWAHFQNTPVTLDLVPLALPDLPTTPPGSTTTPDTVIDEVARHFAIPRAEITSRRRDRRTALARQVAIALMSAQLHLPSKEIASLFGHPDTSAVARACLRISNLCSSDPRFQLELSSLGRLVNSHPRTRR